MKKVLASWGPGRFDAELDKDGKALAPGRQAGRHADSARLRPRRRQPAHLDRLRIGPLLERLCGGDRDARLRDVLRRAARRQGPISRSPRRAARATPAAQPDQATAKLAALHFYQLAIPAPKAPAGSFDEAAFERGKALFNGTAKCATCHVPPLFTEPGNNLHAPERDRRRRLPGRPLADPHVSHRAAGRPVDPPEGRLLSRRPLRHPARRRQPL